MKFLHHFFNKRYFVQWLRYTRSVSMLALLAVVILLTGSMDVKSIDTLEMDIWDPAGNKRLLQAGVPVHIETDLYFGFPEETQKRRIRIAGQPWMEVDGECYRLDYAQVCQLPGKQVSICFSACDEDGGHLEQEFYFVAIEEERPALTVKK